MSLKEKVARELEYLPSAEVKKVADYVAFLRFRERRRQASKQSEATLPKLYGEFAAEDSHLAEQGMDDYARGLEAEDRL